MPIRRLLAVALALGLVLAACDDDPSGPCSSCPETNPWSEVDLGVTLVDQARLLAVDCADGDCLALGYSVQAVKRAGPLNGISPLFYAPDRDGGWSAATLPDLPPENYLDLVMAGAGQPVVMGWGTGGSQPPYSYAAIYDGRTDPPTAFGRSGGILLTVDGEGDFFVAGGAQTAGLLLSSTAPGSWDADWFPKSGTNEGGFQDVDVRGDVAVACGFDDGADTLQVVLRRTKTTDWKMLNRDGLPFGTELRCIAVSATGAIFVGGVQYPGGPQTQAFAAVRSAAGEWATLVLPDPVALGRVNDILLATDGSIYLACSSEYEDTSTGWVLRVTGTGASPEIGPLEGELLDLAEANDGTIYAVGSRRLSGSSVREPVLLERAP